MYDPIVFLKRKNKIFGYNWLVFDQIQQDAGDSGTKAQNMQNYLWLLCPKYADLPKYHKKLNLSLYINSEPYISV